MNRHNHHHRHNHRGPVTDVIHHVVCRHQVEIGIWPPRADVNFADDWTANPIDKQIRFEATVYNSKQGHLWDVRDINGNPGLGTIDASGVYRAPPKGGQQSGTTEIVIATAREDRLRKAYAYVTLVGIGPEPRAMPSIDVSPRRADLYYQTGHNNNYIDVSNKLCKFRAFLFDGSDTIEWLVDGTSHGFGPWFVYQTPNAGGAQIVTVTARMNSRHAILDEAKVLQRNYDWPGA